jgi:predicted DNA-binding transcriptional regulator AlpA
MAIHTDALPSAPVADHQSDPHWLLRVPEAAKLLDLHPRSLYRLVAEGETFGDSVRYLSPKCLRFSAKALRAYCDGDVDGDGEMVSPGARLTPGDPS